MAQQQDKATQAQTQFNNSTQNNSTQAQKQFNNSTQAQTQFNNSKLAQTQFNNSTQNTLKLPQTQFNNSTQNTSTQSIMDYNIGGNMDAGFQYSKNPLDICRTGPIGRPNLCEVSAQSIASQYIGINPSQPQCLMKLTDTRDPWCGFA
jgi:hypothetical protein